jgi:hypothetical protein
MAGLQRAAGNQAALQFAGQPTGASAARTAAGPPGPGQATAPLPLPLVPRGAPLIVQRVAGVITRAKGAYLHDESGAKIGKKRHPKGTALDVDPETRGRKAKHVKVEIMSGLSSDDAGSGYMNSDSLQFTSDEKGARQSEAYGRLQDVAEIGAAGAGSASGLGAQAVSEAKMTATDKAVDRLIGIGKNAIAMGLDAAAPGLGTGASAVDSAAAIYGKSQEGKGTKETLKQSASVAVGFIPIIGPYLGFARDVAGLLQIGLRKATGQFDVKQAEKKCPTTPPATPRWQPPTRRSSWPFSRTRARWAGRTSRCSSASWAAARAASPGTSSRDSSVSAAIAASGREPSAIC